MRRAVVTGASRGIGRAITGMLLAEGWGVVGLSRSRPPLVHPSFAWYEADLAEEPCRHAALPGPFDALVHCAGIRGPHGPLSSADPEAWERTIRTNLLGTYHVVRLALPTLCESGDGRILLFSGGGAFSPEPGYAAYAASKGATVALMETLAAELAGSTVTVNCVAPGFVATDIHRGTPHAGRADAPDALANVVACVRHLLSPVTRGLTGKTVSAQHDDYLSVDQTTVDAVNASEMGRRDRHKLRCVRSLVRPKHLAVS